MAEGIKENISAIFNLIRGWRTKRKIVVFESDDWGSLRTDSSDILDKLINLELLGNSQYNKYDALESDYDLLELFEILESFSDLNNRHPVFTANCVMANPDFARIKENEFSVYQYKLVTDSFQEYEDSINCHKLWIEGDKMGVFHPQFHCREHLNTYSWMAALRAGDPGTIEAFNYNFWSHGTKFPDAREGHFLASFSTHDNFTLSDAQKIATDGLEIFERVMGYKSKSWVAPNFIWPEALEKTLFVNGVLFIQGQRKQLIPVDRKGSGYLKMPHYLGEINRNGQIYLVRNSHFEPFSDPGMDWVGNCMIGISRAFFWGKPAIISSHRVNYVGRICKENRDRNLVLLKELLAKIIRKWPDVEFYTTDQLGDHILADLDGKNY